MKSHSKECIKLNDHSFKEVCICSDDSNSDENEMSEQKERPEWSWLNDK